MALGTCFQETVLANLNLLPELHLHSTFSSAPVSSVVGLGESNDLGQEAIEHTPALV